MNLTRCFLGVPLSEEASYALVRASRTFLMADPSWAQEKWVPRENLHVTLTFIGPVAESDLNPLQQALGEALAPFQAFDLVTTGIIPVPNARQCTMLWSALADPMGAFRDLTRITTAVARSFGADIAEKPIRPHVTLARARHSRAASSVALEAVKSSFDASIGSMSVREVTLYSSTLTRSAPVYEELRTWQLCGGL